MSSNKDPTWVPLRAVVAIQGELIAEHGGLNGPPGQGDLEAALGRPVNLHAYPDSSLALTADELDAVATFQALAAGDLTEDHLVEWIAANSAAID